MRENIRDRNWLEHIVEAINRILKYTDGMSREDLDTDKLQYYGLVKNIEIIGEATYKLTRAFRKEHPETPWEGIAKMRHVLIHDYYQISTNEVWKVLHSDLVPLLEQVNSYLATTNWDEWEKNEQVIIETAAHKSLTQTARRMKVRGYSLKEIMSITGLPADDIEAL